MSVVFMEPLFSLQLYCLSRTQHSFILEQGNYIKSKHLKRRCFGIQQNNDSVSQNAPFNFSFSQNLSIEAHFVRDGTTNLCEILGLESSLICHKLAKGSNRRRNYFECPVLFGDSLHFIKFS